MSEMGTTLANEIKKHSDQLQALRDEIRVKLHLASMDAKASWRELEPQILEVEKSAKGMATEATRTLLTETVKKLLDLRSKLNPSK
jgi:hypothetical protein